MTGRPQIAFELTAEGAALFAQITAANVGRQLAIVLDGQLQSAPVIRETITAGRAVISGNFTDQQAKELVSLLENRLPANVRVLEERQIDAATEKAYTQRKAMKIFLLLAACAAILFAIVGTVVYLMVSRAQSRTTPR
jgi:preprotein translocase subunit SecD